MVKGRGRREGPTSAPRGSALEKLPEKASRNAVRMGTDRRIGECGMSLVAIGQRGRVPMGRVSDAPTMSILPPGFASQTHQGNR